MSLEMFEYRNACRGDETIDCPVSAEQELRTGELLRWKR